MQKKQNSMGKNPFLSTTSPPPPLLKNVGSMPINSADILKLSLLTCFGTVPYSAIISDNNTNLCDVIF